MDISLNQEDPGTWEPRRRQLCSHHHAPPRFSCQKLFPAGSEDARLLPGVSVAGNIPFHRQEEDWLVLAWLPPKPRSRQSRSGAEPRAAPGEQLARSWVFVNLCVPTQESIGAPGESPHLRQPRAAGRRHSPPLPRAASSVTLHRRAPTTGKKCKNRELAAESAPVNVQNTSG